MTDAATPKTPTRSYHPMFQVFLARPMPDRRADSPAAYDSQDSELRPVRQIGKGQCGTVYAMKAGSSLVFKAMNSGKHDQLHNDYCTHLRVQNALTDPSLELTTEVNIPKLDSWIGPEDNEFWKTNLDRFPQGSAPTYGIVSRRIYAVPLEARCKIFDTFAPRSIDRNNFFDQVENNDCLIRLYLGRRAQRNPAHVFKLRNFDLMVNEMELLRLNILHFAKIMALTLAVMHWKAGVDANDVEFVLGTKHSTVHTPMVPTSTPKISVSAIAKENTELFGEYSRSVGVWLLDFDQCKTFTEDDEGIEQLERAFFFNDPYYPRPGSNDTKDVELWTSFKNQYLDASGYLTKSKMPGQFIAAVEAEGKRRHAADSLFS